MELFWKIVFVFVAVPLIAVAYSNGVHRLGAWLIRLMPERMARAFSKRLYTNEYDRARDVDAIASARNAKARKAGKPVSGEIVD